MPFPRRDFLVRTGLALAAGALAPSSASARSQLRSLATWSAVRREFDLDPAYVHMCGMLFASHPRQVREAIERHRSGLDANPVHYLYDNRWDFEAAVLRAASEYLGVDPSEIALTDSTTMGLAVLYSGLELGEGQEVLTTVHDHFSTRESLRLRAARCGATIREISLFKDLDSVTADEIVASIARAITRHTRVVALTWVHSSTGLKIPVRRIADEIARENARRGDADRILLCVDGVHGIGVEDVSLPELGCDFFVAGCHKWLFGPRGTGFVWGREAAWHAVTPTIPTFSGTGTPGEAMTPGGFHSFEHRWALAEAFDFQKRIGRSRVSARVHALNAQLKEGLAAMSHVHVRTPASPDLSAGIVCFEVDGMETSEAIERLWDAKVVGSVAPYGSHYARLTPGIANSERDVARALRAVSALAKPAPAKRAPSRDSVPSN